MDKLEKIKSIKTTKYVGILINNNSKMFSNGVVQNAYFIYQCLENIGMKCQFLCPQSDPSVLEYVKIPLKQLSLNPSIFNPSDYHTLITVGVGLTPDEYTLLKKHNVFVVAFTCGNSIMLHMEEFVRGPLQAGQTTYIGKSAMCDEVWVIPSYKHCLDYISLVRGKPAFIVPHLWSPHFVMGSTSKDLFYNYAIHSGKKIDIIIMEPNTALFKNSWIPILACEKLNQLDATIIENVYVFCFPEHSNSSKMLENLTIASKVRKFKRLALPEILSHFNTKTTVPIILSHQILNSLNYLYYEAIYFGWPLVHNSVDLDGCGYFYPENDISTCASVILDVFTRHNKEVEQYKNNACKYLKQVDPLDKDMGEIWDGAISVGISKCLE